MWPYLTLEKYADFHIWFSIAIREIRRASATSIISNCPIIREEISCLCPTTEAMSLRKYYCR
jgi:hypothetical protein